jgi:hypothetical protein
MVHEKLRAAIAVILRENENRSSMNITMPSAGISAKLIKGEEWIAIQAPFAKRSSSDIATLES